MLTPSGRFQPDKKICFSMSDFHPGSVSLRRRSMTFNFALTYLIPIVESSLECGDNVRACISMTSYCHLAAARIFSPTC